jgi:hypothetical protein
VLVTVLAAVGPAVRLSGAAVVAPPVSRGSLLTRLLLAVVLAVAAAGLVQLRGSAPQAALALVAGRACWPTGGRRGRSRCCSPPPPRCSGSRWPGSRPGGSPSGRPAARPAAPPPRSPRSPCSHAADGRADRAAVDDAVVEDRVAGRFPAPVTVVARGDAALSDDLATGSPASPGWVPRCPVRESALADGTRTTVVDPAAFPALLDGAVDAGSLAALAPGTVGARPAGGRRPRRGRGRCGRRGAGRRPAVVAVYRSSGVLGPSRCSRPTPRSSTPPRPCARSSSRPRRAPDADALRSAVTAVVGPDPAAAVLALAGLRADLESAVALVRAIALGLVATTVLAGVVGVAVSLLLAQRERHREAVTLRALGLTPGQVVAAAGLESGLLGAAGALVGLGLGGAFGVLAVFALGEAAVVPVDEVLLGAGALVAVAVVAGTLPAARSARGRRGARPLTRYRKTIVLPPSTSTRSSRCQRRPRASTSRSMSRPRRTTSSTVSPWSTRVTSCSMIGPSSRSEVT